jgi:hypothetical protein
MFYTVVSRLPFIANDNSGTKFLKIFIFGSVLYVLVSYYIHSESRGEIFEKLKQWYYHVLGVDLVVAGLLTYFMSPSSSSSDDEDPGHGYSPEQVREIQHRMKIMRANEYNEARQQIRQSETESKDEEHSHRSPFKKKKQDSSESKSSSSCPPDKKEKKQEKKKKSSEDEDTHIPVYNGKD